MSASGIPGGGSAAFQKALKALAVEFAHSLPERMDAAGDLLRQCRERPQDSSPLDELHRLMHTIAGSAATFGRQQLGTLARETEARLAALRTDTHRSAASFDEVAAQLEQLRAAAGAT